MESMKRIIPVAAAALLGAVALTGCQSDAVKAENTAKASYEKALAEAKAERAKAKKMGGEWRDIGKFLKKADKAAAAGDYKTATKLANKVAFQAKMGQQQAKEQAGVGNPSYLTD